jgi:prepilin-type N-terminal cleavage/methylation domain-containing protein
MRKRQKGFSLIELLVVVAIMLVIAAIAVPSMLAAKRNANTSAAVGNMRQIVAAEFTFAQAYNNGYSLTLPALGGVQGTACVPSMATACILDSAIATNGGANGYTYAVAGGTDGVTPPDQFFLTGVANNATSGNLSLCATDDGIVRQEPGSVSATTAVASYATCITLNKVAN